MDSETKKGYRLEGRYLSTDWRSEEGKRVGDWIKANGAQVGLDTELIHHWAILHSIFVRSGGEDAVEEDENEYGEFYATVADIAKACMNDSQQKMPAPTTKTQGSRDEQDDVLESCNGVSTGKVWAERCEPLPEDDDRVELEQDFVWIDQNS